jgi:tetratricopeptide (TPR) repeat protein
MCCLGNYTEAIEFYNKTLAIDPNNTVALTNKDTILRMLGNNSTYSTYVNGMYGIFRNRMRLVPLSELLHLFLQLDLIPIRQLNIPG